MTTEEKATRAKKRKINSVKRTAKRVIRKRIKESLRRPKHKPYNRSTKGVELNATGV